MEPKIGPDVANDKVSDKPKENVCVDFEEALDLTGFGKYHWLLTFVTGLAFLSTAYQNARSSYTIAAAQCDLKLTSEAKGLFNAVFLIGQIASAVFWGILADHIGRKKVLVTSLLFDALVSFASGFVQSFPVFLVFRFLNGFIIGAPGTVCCTYLGEFVGEKDRNRCVCCLGVFFTFAWLLLPIVAKEILPMEWEMTIGSYKFNSWRIFVLITFIPSLLPGLLLLIFFPESPKYLYSQGDERAALSIMTTVYTINTGKPKETYPVKLFAKDSMEGVPKRRSVILDVVEMGKVSGRPMIIFAGVKSQIISVLSPPHLSATVLASLLSLTNMFGYYGLGLWLPELFERYEEYHQIYNGSVRVCQLHHAPLPSKNQSKMAITFDEPCQRSSISDTVYFNAIIIGIVCLTVNIGCVLLTNTVGLRRLTILTMLISGLSALAIYFQNTSTENLIISCIFLSFSGAANIIIDTVNCDLFPTRVRALGTGIALLIGRIGPVCSNFLLGYFLDTVCELPIFVMAAALLCGAVLGLFLPKRKEELKLFTNKKT